VSHEPATIAPADLINVLERAETWKARLDGIVEGLPQIRLVYEDDLADASTHQATVDRLCATLGLPSAPVTTNLVRVTPGSMSDRVTNYDEIVDALARSRFAELLT
jgi:hypothetical protein